jgi:hypothetical protein
MWNKDEGPNEPFLRSKQKIYHQYATDYSSLGSSIC